MKKPSQLGFSIIFVLLAAILMISVYTVVLQRSYGCIAEEAAVARDTKCADVIHQVVSDKFTGTTFRPSPPKRTWRRPAIRSFSRSSTSCGA